MRNNFVLPTGLVTPLFEENLKYYQDGFRSIFGDGADLDPEGFLGQMAGLFAKRDTDIFELAGEIYYSRDPDQAMGVALDAICSETGVIRIGEGRTIVEDVLLDLDIGVTLPVGSQARQNEGAFQDVIYNLLEVVTASLTNSRVVAVEVQEPTGTGELYSLTIDGVVYPYTSLITDTAETIALELKNEIELGTFGGTVDLDGAIMTITQIAQNYSLALSSNITVDNFQTGGSFQADTAGQIPCPSNTLNTIVTTTSGWNRVSNPSDGLTGRAKETDSELRIRRANTLLTGNATEDAIVSAISNKVSGIGGVSIQSNRTYGVNSEGLPPKSFEVVAIGGTSQQIGEVIWETQGVSIESFGTELVIVQDIEGNSQEVRFSRPSSKFIWVKVKRSLYSEEVYPADGDTAIKLAIVQWASLNQPIGKDVIRQRLATPIYSIQGIEDIEIEIASTDSPTGSPVYDTFNIPILSKEFGEFKVERITIEALV